MNQTIEDQFADIKRVVKYVNNEMTNLVMATIGLPAQAYRMNDSAGPAHKISEATDKLYGMIINLRNEMADQERDLFDRCLEG